MGSLSNGEQTCAGQVEPFFQKFERLGASRNPYVQDIVKEIVPVVILHALTH